MTQTRSDEAAVNEGCYFDEPAALRVKTFFETFLCHSKGEWAGKPFVLLPWQWEEFIKPLYGWKQANGLRRFKFAYGEIAKKNGKSEMCSGMCLFHLLADNEPGAEVYCCASDRDQASIVFNEAANMVSASKAISKHLTIIPSQKRIVYKKTKSFFRALSSDTKKSGYDASFICFDELHEQDKRTLWDTLVYSGAARRQPLIVSITNSGFDRETICWEQHEYARKVLAGKDDGGKPFIDTSFLPLLYCTDETADDWKLESTWKKANPSWDHIINQDLFRSDFQAALNEPRKESNFRRYHLSQWVGHAEQWISSRSWEGCKQVFTEESLYGQSCVVGADLARKHDLAAVVYLFSIDGKKHIIPRFFIPKERAAKKEEFDRVPYGMWERHGFVIFTEGDTIDYDCIRKQINKDAEHFKIKEIGYDPYNGEELFRHELQDEDGFDVVPIVQTAKQLGPATSYLEKLILDKRLVHADHPVMNWCAANAVVKEEGDGIILSKGKATARIDGMSALVIALNRLMVDEGDGTSIYDERGPIFV